MRKANPAPKAKIPEKLSITPRDLGYDSEFSTEVTPAFNNSPDHVSRARTLHGTIRQNLSLYPGE